MRDGTTPTSVASLSSPWILPGPTHQFPFSPPLTGFCRRWPWLQKRMRRPPEASSSVEGHQSRCAAVGDGARRHSLDESRCFASHHVRCASNGTRIWSARVSGELSTYEQPVRSGALRGGVPTEDVARAFRDSSPGSISPWWWRLGVLAWSLSLILTRLRCAPVATL